jgi:acyl-CoA reductase-like NAD-dependent aldehyde dehydrogenase
MTHLTAINPRTGVSDYSFEAASIDQVKQTVHAARVAQKAWAESGLEHRVRVMNLFADALVEFGDSLRAALTIDTGRKKISAEEVDAVFHMTHGHAANAPKILAQVSGPSSNVPDVDFIQQYVAYGVVGVISPWNFPMVLSFIDALPALLAGNTVVIKPSEVTPRFVDPLVAAIASVPELVGVISLVRGAAETGQALIENVDLVVFTGSIPTGRKIAEAAARQLIPCFLELGGKDAAIVLNGADIDRAATSIVRSAVYNSGQVCYAIERVYVDDRVHDELVQKLQEKCDSLTLNFPSVSSGDIGPFIFPQQAQIVSDQLNDAVAKGARIVTGGDLVTHDGGTWMGATVVADVDHSMVLMIEETFGPVIPVMRFSTEAQGVELVNDTVFGLSGAVFAKDIEKGTEIASLMNAGGVSINDTELPRAITLDAEKNAFGQSGIGGSRYGAGTLLRYVRKKALIRNHGAVKPLTALAEE